MAPVSAGFGTGEGEVSHLMRPATTPPTAPTGKAGVGALPDHAVVVCRWMGIQADVALMAALWIVLPWVAKLATTLVVVVADRNPLPVRDVPVSLHPGVAVGRRPPRRGASRGLGPLALAWWPSVGPCRWRRYRT